MGQVWRIGPTHWQWLGRKDDRVWRVDVVLRDGMVSVEDGPDERTARSHEAMGCDQEASEFLRRPYRWIDNYPDLKAALVEDLSRLGFGKREG